MLTLPFSDSIPIYVALGLLIASLAALVSFICRRLYRLIARLRGKHVRPLGVVGSTFRLLLILLAIAVSAAVLMLLGFIQSYVAFTHQKRIATVYCTALPKNGNEMTLRLVTVDSPTGGRLYRFRLLGQQWAIEGHILKWEDWLNFSGLQTMYKLTRVRGRYIRADDEASGPASAYSLISNQDDPGWRWLYKYGEMLPFVHAVYGNTVFSFPSTTKRFGIYVTTSGFMAKEEEGD
jgi:hypothetical protein